jgi:hypothetical protein
VRGPVVAGRGKEHRAGLRLLPLLLLPLLLLPLLLPPAAGIRQPFVLTPPLPSCRRAAPRHAQASPAPATSTCSWTPSTCRWSAAGRAPAPPPPAPSSASTRASVSRAAPPLPAAGCRAAGRARGRGRPQHRGGCSQPARRRRTSCLLCRAKPLQARTCCTRCSASSAPRCCWTPCPRARWPWRAPTTTWTAAGWARLPGAPPRALAGVRRPRAPSAAPRGGSVRGGRSLPHSSLRQPQPSAGHWRPATHLPPPLPLPGGAAGRDAQPDVLQDPGQRTSARRAGAARQAGARPGRGAGVPGRRRR